MLTSNDRSYRMLVILQRADREKYWTFHCPRCGSEILPEVTNAIMESISDVFDQANPDYGHSVRCPERHCRIRYYFVLSQ